MRRSSSDSVRSSVRWRSCIEKAGILNGNHSLGGEIPHQRNLLVGEGPDFLPIDAERPDQLVFLEHRHLQEGAGPPSSATASIPG